MFWLFDFIHLLECIHKNWLRKKSHELSFEENGETFIAKWNNLVNLYDFEVNESENNSGVRDLSNLNEVSVRTTGGTAEGINLFTNVSPGHHHPAGSANGGR